MIVLSLLVDLMSLQSYDKLEKITLEDLLTELNEVTDWFSFGISLEIPDTILRGIKQEFELVEDCKREMLMVWLQQSHPTWKTIVIALTGIDMDDLAIRIANEYGELYTQTLYSQLIQVFFKLSVEERAHAIGSWIIH